MISENMRTPDSTSGQHGQQKQHGSLKLMRVIREYILDVRDFNPYLPDLITFLNN